jgi:hypothetical protein
MTPRWVASAAVDLQMCRYVGGGEMRRKEKKSRKEWEMRGIYVPADVRNKPFLRGNSAWRLLTRASMNFGA